MSKKVTRPAVSRYGGFDYAVLYKPAGSIKVDGDDAFALTDHDAQEIHAEEGMKPEREVALLVHEAMHQMVSVTKVVFQGKPDDVEEQVCTFVGDAVAGHIRDNPDFWRYLVGRLARAPRKKKAAASQ
jgi:hypothetical protein